MARERRWIDIGHVPELLRIVEDVRRSRRPRVLRKDKEDLAVVIPAEPTSLVRTKRRKTAADREAFLSSAGSWKAIVDVERLAAGVRDSRRRSSRPPVSL